MKTYDCQETGMPKPDRRKVERGETPQRHASFFDALDNLRRNLADGYWDGYVSAMKTEFAALMSAPAAPADAVPAAVGHVVVPLTRGGLEVGEAEVEWTREFAALIDGNPGKRFAIYATPAASPDVQAEPVATPDMQPGEVAPYNAKFSAISAATKIEAGGIGVSVKAFDAELFRLGYQVGPATPEPADRAALTEAFRAAWRQEVGGGYSHTVGRDVALRVAQIAVDRLAAAPSAQPVEARDKLHTFLNAAAGEGYVLDGVDAADLYVALFPERYAAATAQIITGAELRPGDLPDAARKGQEGGAA